jgi:hypothetical protein
MQAIGMLLLAAATAGDGFGYGDAGVGLKKWKRAHVVVGGDAPGAPMYTAANLAGGAGMAAAGRRFATTRSQIYFLDPNGMQVGWQTSSGPNGERVYLPAQLTVPARYNFSQGYIYRLKLTNIPGRAAAVLYPSIEVAPTTPMTDAFLAHNTIPVQFTNEDFDQVIDGGNFVTKVIYLPDPKYQELAVSGVETLVSTRLEPGVDPILEADKRGTILVIVRLGAIDLESPALPPGGVAGASVVGGGVAPPTVPSATNLPAGALPPGFTPTPPPTQGTVNLDPAPHASAAPPNPSPMAPPIVPSSASGSQRAQTSVSAIAERPVITPSQ